MSQVEQNPDGATPITFGEAAVGLTFNPGKNDEVASIKRKCADLIDDLNNSRLTTSNDKKRMYSEAITNLQTAQMWAVKAATWPY